MNANVRLVSTTPPEELIERQKRVVYDRYWRERWSQILEEADLDKRKRELKAMRARELAAIDRAWRRA
jgi:hypothetical protein